MQLQLVVGIVVRDMQNLAQTFVPNTARKKLTMTGIDIQVRVRQYQNRRVSNAEIRRSQVVCIAEFTINNKYLLNHLLQRSSLEGRFLCNKLLQTCEIQAEVQKLNVEHSPELIIKSPHRSGPIICSVLMYTSTCSFNSTCIIIKDR